MRHLHTFRLLSVVLGMLGIVFLATLSACGGGDTAPREVATVTPIVVLTVENGGEDGADLGGLNNDGYPAEGGLVINWPVNLKAQVFMPADGEFDGQSIVGDVITHVGKVHFEYSDGERDESEQLIWTAFKSNVEINGSGYASYNNFQGLEDLCPDIFLLRAHFTPTTQNGGPKRGNGSAIGEAGSDTYQEFTMGSIDNPIQRAWIVVHQGRDTHPEEQIELSVGPGAPVWIPGTRAVTGEDGTIETFPISFTLFVELRGVHNYTLFGKSHISNGDGEESDDDFELEMNVSSCSESEEFSISFEGTSPRGMGPIISHLFIGGSTWEIGDPHAAKDPPPGHAPTPTTEDPS